MSKVSPVKDGNTVYQPSISAPIVEHMRKIVCVKCGCQYGYRGKVDDDAYALGAGLCDDCKRDLGLLGDVL